MDRDVSEINVEQLRLVFIEQMLDQQRLRGGEICQGAFRNVRNQNRRRKCVVGFPTTKTGSKGKTLRLLALLRNDHRPKALQRGDLPVDVQHLRLEKRRAIAGDDRRRALGHA